MNGLGTVGYSYLRSPKSRFAWGGIALGLLLWMVSGLALGLSGEIYPGVVSGQPDELLSLVAGCALALLVFGSAFLTPHLLTPEGVAIRQGLIFRGIVHYRNVAAVQPTDKKPIGGLGLRIYPDTLFVVTWPDRLVSIRLRKPQRFRLFRLLPLWKVGEVVVNVDDPDRFILELRRRIRSESMGMGTEEGEEDGCC